FLLRRGGWAGHRIRDTRFPLLGARQRRVDGSAGRRCHHRTQQGRAPDPLARPVAEYPVFHSRVGPVDLKVSKGGPIPLCLPRRPRWYSWSALWSMRTPEPPPPPDGPPSRRLAASGGGMLRPRFAGDTRRIFSGLAGIAQKSLHVIAHELGLQRGDIV